MPLSAATGKAQSVTHLLSLSLPTASVWGLQSCGWSQCCLDWRENRGVCYFRKCNSSLQLCRWLPGSLNSLPAAEWWMSREKKNADRITAASFTNQENKILASWCYFSSKAFHPLHPLSTCDYNDEYNLEKFKILKKKSSKQRFSLFFLSRMHRIKTLLSLPGCQQILKGSWVAGTVQRYKFTAMRMVVDDNSYWVEKAQIKNNQVSITACRNIQ